VTFDDWWETKGCGGYYDAQAAWQAAQETERERITLLTETFKAMDNAIKNGMPDFALLEVDRIIPIIESWENNDG